MVCFNFLAFFKKNITFYYSYAFNRDKCKTINKKVLKKLDLLETFI